MNHPISYPCSIAAEISCLIGENSLYSCRKKEASISTFSPSLLQFCIPIWNPYLLQLTISFPHNRKEIYKDRKNSVVYVWSVGYSLPETCLCRAACPQAAAPPCLSLWERCPEGAERMFLCPLSHGYRRASSPIGRAKNARPYKRILCRERCGQRSDREAASYRSVGRLALKPPLPQNCVPFAAG